MSQGRRPDTGEIIGGCFLVAGALLLLLLGGSCTVMIVGSGYGDYGSMNGMLPFLLISLALFAAGGIAMWFGVRLLMGKYR